MRADERQQRQHHATAATAPRRAPDIRGNQRSFITGHTIKIRLTSRWQSGRLPGKDRDHCSYSVFRRRQARKTQDKSGNRSLICAITVPAALVFALRQDASLSYFARRADNFRFCLAWAVVFRVLFRFAADFGFAAQVGRLRLRLVCKVRERLVNFPRGERSGSFVATRNDEPRRVV